MAEEEIAKHTKKIYRIWTSGEHNFWQKLKEFLVEVFIIVFAISLSIWFHNRSDHASQQEDVKKFMLGLKSDLQNDTAEMQNDKRSYEKQRITFNYITHIKMNGHLSTDSLNEYDNWMFNITVLNPNSGRFEGFKSSGKVGEIENTELQNDIMDLYQEDIPALLASTYSYTDIKKKFFDYVSGNRKRLTDSTNNLSTILTQDEAQNICIVLSSPQQVLERYDVCIDKMKKIMTEINKEYNLKE
jgi:hypothetical protein